MFKMFLNLTERALFGQIHLDVLSEQKTSLEQRDRMCEFKSLVTRRNPR